MNRSWPHGLLVMIAVSGGACDDTQWQREPKLVVQVQALPCGWASAATRLVGRQVAVGSTTFCVLFVTPANRIDAFELETHASIPRRGLPATPEQRMTYNFPPLLLLDAATGALEEVPWARWAECTGQTFGSVGSVSSVSDIVSISADKRSATLAGTAVATAAPYVTAITLPPGGTNVAVFSAFGPTHSHAGIMAPSSVAPLGDVVVEWLRGRDPKNRLDIAHRLMQSASPSYAAMSSGGRTGAWTPDGRYYIRTHDDKLWLVPNPEFAPDAGAKPAKR